MLCPFPESYCRSRPDPLHSNAQWMTCGSHPHMLCHKFKDPDACSVVRYPMAAMRSTAARKCLDEGVKDRVIDACQCEAI
jgi:hypothetical protein